MTIQDKLLLLSEAYTKTGVAGMLGVHLSTVTRYLHGEIGGSYKTVKKIEKLYGEHEEVSNCCGAPVYESSDMVARCKDCNEMSKIELITK